MDFVTANNEQITPTAFALCLDNGGYPASLETRKIYQTLPITPTETGYLRVIDESGDDYLYPTRLFLMIALPVEAERIFTGAA